MSTSRRWFVLLTGRGIYSGSIFNYNSTNNHLHDQVLNCAMPRHRRRRFSTMNLTANLRLISSNDKSPVIKNFKLEEPIEKPLVVMLSWLLAKPKHIYKFANYYNDKGYDVLNVNITPWQLLWPMQGTQVVAREVLKFLDVNRKYGPLLVHGFSVGGYQWGEVLVQIDNNRERYKHVLDRIVGQVWDSAADLSEVTFGFPMALFPTNTFLQNAMKRYLLYHLKAFDKIATRHYVRASQVFHGNLVQAPALIFLSKTDPVGAESSNVRLRDNWESVGIKVYWKCWEKSPHVGHYYYHPEEYVEMLDKFLSNIGMLQCEEKMQAKL